MTKVLIVYNDKTIQETITKVLKSNFHNLEQIIQKDNFKSILSLCKSQQFSLIFLEANKETHEECFVLADQIHHLPFQTFIIFLIDCNDSSFLINTIQERNERFILKPINVNNLLSITNECLTYLSNSIIYNQTVNQLNNKINLLKSQIESNLAYRIIINMPKPLLLEELDNLNITFTEGMAFVFPLNTEPSLFDPIIQYIEKCQFILIKTIYGNYNVLFIINEQKFSLSQISTLETQINKINQKKFILGVGYIKNDIANLHVSYNEAMDEISASKRYTHLREETNSAEILTQYALNQAYYNFLLLKDNQIKIVLDSLARHLFSYNPSIIKSCTVFFIQNYTKRVSLSYNIDCEAVCKQMIDCIGDFLSDSDHLSNLLLKLYNQLVITVKHRRNDEAHAHLYKILQYIDNNHTDKNISLNSLANHLNFSTFYICKILKRYAGFSYIDYLNNCRVEHAKLLLKTDIKIKTIASLVGYNSTTYFERVFKQITFLTPKEYRFQNISLF